MNFLLLSPWSNVPLFNNSVLSFDYNLIIFLFFFETMFCVVAVESKYLLVFTTCGRHDHATNASRQ